MRPAGLAAFERRREDRSGIYAYEVGQLTWPEDYEERLRANARRPPSGTAPTRPTARPHQLGPDRKQEATRDRRMAELIDDCANCASSGRSARHRARLGGSVARACSGYGHLWHCAGYYDTDRGACLDTRWHKR